MWTQEKITKELQRIQANAPKLLQQKVVTKSMITPNIKMVFEKALESNIAEEKKAEVRKILASGVLEKQEYTTDEKIAKKLDSYMQRELKKAVKEGRLPSKKVYKQLQKQWTENNTLKV
jgi:cytochrome c-type biogenesis protein CcmE